MMPKPWTPLVLLSVSVAAVGCGDAAGPDPAGQRVRTLLVHHRNTGENLLWNTDGTRVGALGVVTRGMLPLGAHAPEGAVVLLDGTAIVLVTRSRPESVDTLIVPAPASLSPASFSADARFVALVSYAPASGLLVYDRANQRVDTLPLGGADPVLPPAFSPDATQIALVTLTPLSILVTTIPLDGDGNPQTRYPAISRFRNRLIFGWPRWGSGGLRLAVRRTAESGVDTLLVGVFDPEVDGAVLDEEFRALMAPDNGSSAGLSLGDLSTYALTADGQVLALGAAPGGSIPHGVYIATPGTARVRTVLSDPGQYPVFPLFLQE